MLVLSRKPGESLILANSIRVTIVDVSGGVVRIGIDAPREISIVREELHREIEGENLRALASKDRAAPSPSGELLGRLRTSSEEPRKPERPGKKRP